MAAYHYVLVTTNSGKVLVFLSTLLLMYCVLICSFAIPFVLFKTVKAQLRRLNFTTKRCIQFPIAKFDPRLNFQEKSHISSESLPLMEKVLKNILH